ncbi:MAG TPA: autotransporter-associated beta strand repeat-containing protein, partial [Tepidisphaeraceae bacterium]
MNVPRLARADNWDPVPGFAGAGDGVVNGGGGNWDVFSPNWTNDGGFSNVTWTNGNFASFGGTAGGFVTIVGGSGVVAGGLSFDPTSDGSTYLLQSQTAADVLTLAGPQVFANADAIINATLGGSAGLTKLGAGTLTLGGANTFSGPVSVAGGRLRVASAANLGTADSLILDGGGIFESTGALIFGGTVSIAPGGGTISLANPGSAVVLSGLLFGNGPLTVDGSGGGVLAVTNPGNFNGSGNGFTGSVSLVGGGSASLSYPIVAPAGQVFSASGGTLALGGSVAGATVSLSSGSLVQASGNGIVQVSGRSLSSGVGVIVGGDVLAQAGGRIEIGDGQDDSAQILFQNSSHLTADGGTIVLRPRVAPLSLDAGSVGAVAVGNGGVLALGAGATADLAINFDVQQSGAWTLANQSNNTLRIGAGSQDTTEGLTLSAQSGVIRYEADTINLGQEIANGTVAVDLRGGTVDISNDAPGRTFTYSPGYVVSGWGQLGTSAANQAHLIPPGGATFYASGPAAIAPTLAIVGGISEPFGSKAAFRIGDNNGISLTVSNATAATAYP